MTVTPVYDANALYPSLLRDLLIRIAIAGTVRAHWTDRILDEVFRNLRADRPDLDSGLLIRTRSLMNDAIRDVLVSDFEHLIDGFQLPDENDRHVLAAAVHTHAEVIVTFNLRDFPDDVLRARGVVAQHPDAFLTQRFEEDPVVVTEALSKISAATKNPHRTVAELVRRLQASGLPMLADRLTLPRG